MNFVSQAACSLARSVSAFHSRAQCGIPVTAVTFGFPRRSFARQFARAQRTRLTPESVSREIANFPRRLSSAKAGGRIFARAPEVVELSLSPVKFAWSARNRARPSIELALRELLPVFCCRTPQKSMAQHLDGTCGLQLTSLKSPSASEASPRR